MGRSPYNPEVVSVEVPRLQLALRVLEHDLDELVQAEPKHGRPSTRRHRAGAGGVGPSGERVPVNDVGDVVVIRELERRVGHDERHAVDGALPPAAGGRG